MSDLNIKPVSDDPVCQKHGIRRSYPGLTNGCRKCHEEALEAAERRSFQCDASAAK